MLTRRSLLKGLCAAVVAVPAAVLGRVGKAEPKRIYGGNQNPVFSGDTGKYRGVYIGTYVSHEPPQRKVTWTLDDGSTLEAYVQIR